MHVPMVVTRFLDRAVRLYGDKAAVICGDERFTYRQYAERTGRLARALVGLGVKPGDRVAYVSSNCHRLLESYFGVIRAGGILLPLNIRLSARELAFILNHSEARVLFVHPDLISLAMEMRGELKTVERYILMGDPTSGRPESSWESYEALLSAAPPVPEPPLGDENAVAELFYTSGTTGSPKGVMLTHRNLYTHALNFIIGLGITDADVQLHTIPLFHVNGWGVPHTLTCMGGRHVLLDRFDPATVCELVEREKVTVMYLVPTMLNTLLNYPKLERHDLRSLARVVVGGSPVPEQFVRLVSEKLGCRFITAYGLTETSPGLSVGILKHHMTLLPEGEQYRRQSMTGMAVANAELRVVDEDGQDVLPDGKQIGEIVARGNNVMLGYWRDPEETARALQDGWFHTGDMATIDDEGYLNIVDRKKDLIISGGENVASVEIENALYSHAAVLECAVVAMPDDRWGEVPKAVVVLREGARATGEDLIAHCRSSLARFKAPKSVEIVNDLPKTGTGKILKSVLRDQAWGGREKRVN